MSEQVPILNSLGIEADQFIATPYGGRLLTGRVQAGTLPLNRLREVVESFTVDPAACQEDLLEQADIIGNGTMSQVYGIGPLAVKLSTPETINGLRTSEKPLEPEDLVAQVRFMNVLRHYVDGETAGGITTPRHHLAIHVSRDGQRHSLSVMENMRGWSSVEDVLISNDCTAERSAAVLQMIGGRIATAIEGSPFASVLKDLDLDAAGSYGTYAAPLHERTVRGDNILVPETATAFSIETLAALYYRSAAPLARRGRKCRGTTVYRR